MTKQPFALGRFARLVGEPRARGKCQPNGASCRGQSATGEREAGDFPLSLSWALPKGQYKVLTFFPHLLPPALSSGFFMRAFALRETFLLCFLLIFCPLYLLKSDKLLQTPHCREPDDRICRPRAFRLLKYDLLCASHLLGQCRSTRASPFLRYFPVLFVPVNMLPFGLLFLYLGSYPHRLSFAREVGEIIYPGRC